MGNYNLTRQETAETLEISVRSVDRYIKSGKLRSKKKGKLVYVHDEDIKHVGWKNEKKPIIITQSTKKDHSKDPLWDIDTGKKLVKKSDYEKLTKSFEKVYSNLQEQIEKKDETIQSLSVQLGQAQEQVKQSISVSEHNRSQMLLEESKGHIAKQITTLWEEKKALEKTIKDEKFDKMILMIAVFILLMIAAFIWFKNM